MHISRVRSGIVVADAIPDVSYAGELLWKWQKKAVKPPW